MSFHKSFTQRERWSSHLPNFADFQQRLHQKFLRLSLPNRKDERWKYTNLSVLEKPSFNPSQKSLSLSEVKALKCLNIIKQRKSNNIIVIENGQLREDLCEIIDPDLKLIKGVDLSTEDAKRFTHTDESFFPVMNGALFRDISYLCLPKNKKIDNPVFIVQLSVSDEHISASFPRLLIEVGEGACLDLSEIHIDTNDKKNFVNSMTLVTLKENSQLNYLKCQDKNFSSYDYSKVDINMEKEANCQLLSLGLGGLWARQEITVRHKEEMASSQINGLYMSRGKSRTECYTSIEHEKGGGISHQIYKGALSDQARSVFNGRIFIAPHAQKVDASQLNKNLLLSHEAEVNTKPELEIYADDVKAAHGATIGRVSEEEMFYLMSRGIPRQMAEHLLVSGFLGGLVKSIDVLDFQRLASAILENHLKESKIGNKC